MGKRSYAIIGAGALGGYYGARLHHAGHPVHLLMRSDFEHVRAHGLTVESKHGDFSIARPDVYREAADLPAADVVLVCLKTTANGALGDLLPAAVRPGATVVMMQNGLGNEEQAAKALGLASGAAGGIHILGGMAFLCSNKVGPGRIVHLDYDPIRLGEWVAGDRPAGVTKAMEEVAEDFRAAAVHVDLEEDLLAARWKKLVWNIPYNGLTVVLNTTTDELMRFPPTRALCRSLMAETVEIAGAHGRVIGAEFIERMLRDTDRMVSYEPSMKIDYRHGRRLEVEAIHGKAVAAADAKGVAAARIRMLHQQLLFIDGEMGRGGE